MDYSTIFSVDHVTGSLKWLPREREQFKTLRAYRLWNTRFAGKEVGTKTVRGYRSVKYFGGRTHVHRIVFEMTKGAIPEGMDIDHIDGDKENGAPTNLRLATRSQNNYNSKTPRHNVSGYKGVSARRGGWVAVISANKRRHYIGTYNTKWGAHVAVKEAAQRLHGEFANY